jgi:hypothetical protein
MWQRTLRQAWKWQVLRRLCMTIKLLAYRRRAYKDERKKMPE